MSEQHESAIYSGVLTHRRDLAPAHRFAYRMRLLWLDLDEADALFAATPGWSLTRPAVGWLRRRDYLRADTASLKQAVADEIEAQLGNRPNGPIRMLTAPRVFGIGFNPLTLYYCYDRAGKQLQFVLAEVRNTPWLQRHCYALDLRANDATIAPHDKHFHVSPFLPMDMQYHWQLNSPDEDLQVLIRNRRAGTTVFRATLALQREAALTPATLQRELWQHWPQGLKTLLGIYWQAVKLFARRARFYGHPGNTSPAVDRAMTITPPASTTQEPLPLTAPESLR